MVARVKMHSEVKPTVHEVTNVHPLAVDIVVINVVTPGRYPLISPVRTVPYLLKPRVALGVLQTKTGLVSLGNLNTSVQTYRVTR